MKKTAQTGKTHAPPRRTRVGADGAQDKTTARGTEEASLIVVGIGASAGGLESISQLLKQLPADTGMSFIIMQHLSPRQESRLPALLGRVSKMPVIDAMQDTALRPNHIYVVAPGKDARLENTTLCLRARQRRAADGQIDEFFTSLALACADRAIAVVLSGTGTDGTEGVRNVKERGGVTFAEERGSAKFFGMPESAISSGAVDEVLTPAEIARKLVRIGTHPVFRDEIPADGSTAQPHLSGFNEIFRILKAATGVNFTGYKRSTLARRTTRRMVYRRAETLDDYVLILQRDPKEVEALYKELLIHVTGFFRDKAVFQSLCKTIIPRILKEKKGGELRIWVPGCSTGEEAYSIAICVMETLSRLKSQARVQIFGTDLSDSAINKARLGVYPSGISREVSPERLRRFFTRHDNHYRISRSIREMCTFARQNLCEDPPFSKLDIISCRNVLIYFGAALQRKVLPLFYYSLNPSGYLILGGSETIGAFGDHFQLVDKKGKVYTKKISHLPPMKLVEPQPIDLAFARTA